jgi:hypothetical protein
MVEKVHTLAASPADGALHRRSWLLLLHQLPSHPTGLRVRTWRRLNQIGALPVKNGAHTLPDSPGSREQFEWLRTEITAAGGQATIFVAETIDRWAHEALVDEFRRSREVTYAALARECEKLSRRTIATARTSTKEVAAKSLQQLRRQLAAVEEVDFFGSAGRDRVRLLLTDLEERLRGGASGPVGEGTLRGEYRDRLWVTRPRPGVDRMASAWLIRRFIDASAQFTFSNETRSAPPKAVPFDMFGVELSHQGENCTFEVLCDTFALHEPALTRIAAIVHDLDLKDERFGAVEAAAIGTVIDGLQLAEPDDHLLLSSGISLFEALYLKFAHDAQPSRPTPVARRRTTRARRSRRQR